LGYRRIVDVGRRIEREDRGCAGWRTSADRIWADGGVGVDGVHGRVGPDDNRAEMIESIDPPG
jgi:hypothetical protein